MEKCFCVYILTNEVNGTLYVGVTSDIVRRVWEHKSGEVKGFSQRYDLKTLVYFEAFDDPENAILREKKLKRWPRRWKLELINKANPAWDDLYEEICA